MYIACIPFISGRNARWDAHAVHTWLTITSHSDALGMVRDGYSEVTSSLNVHHPDDPDLLHTNLREQRERYVALYVVQFIV